MNSSDSPYMIFNRAEWAMLRNLESLSLTKNELNDLQGINDEISMDEVEDIYLPLSRLLSYYVNANSSRQAVLMKFLRKKALKIPFIIGVAGSVSVGKSTIARVLQTLLSRSKDHPSVALITTDGFLYPNKVLEDRGLMNKKGFPESYDIKLLLQFIMAVKSGKQKIEAPLYSHLIYDIVPDRVEVINQPDILIFEGLNVLQSGRDYPSSNKLQAFVSDFIDFSIYIDADESLLEHWYVSRFLKLREGAFTDPKSFFNNYTKISDDEAVTISKAIWRSINLKNLRKNIFPTRERASLILHKVENHTVDSIRLRK